MINAAKALPFWGLQGAEITFIAARENAVYRVDHAKGTFALRFHRKGYRTNEQLIVELDWMAWLAHVGLSVPAPMRSLAGSYLQKINGVQVDVLTWLGGQTLGTILPTLTAATRRDVFFHLGSVMAQLHEVSDQWPGAARCDRPSWNLDGLLGEAPLWGRFWENPGLTKPEKAMLIDFREKAKDELNWRVRVLDYGLIHADLVPVNVMWTGGKIHLIDFDDGGFGYRLFEIATALLKYTSDPEYLTFKTALIEGYISVRAVDIGSLPLFFALRAVTYVGWNMTRMEEDKTGTRNARFINQAKNLVGIYMKS